MADLPTGPKDAKSTVLKVEEEAIIVAFRRHTLLPLDDCLYALQPTIPHLTRSSLHRCLQRHDISRLPEIEGDTPAKKKFKTYPLGYFHVDIAEVQTAEGKLYLFVARECPIFCVTWVWSMLPERSKDDDDFQRTAGRTFEGLRAA